MKKFIWLLLAFVPVLLSGCGSASGDPFDQEIMLSWTAPGDDMAVGQASAYDLRYSESVDSLTDYWNDCAVIGSVPLPGMAGLTDSVIFTLTVEIGDRFYFAIKSVDDGLPQPDGIARPNWSGISNILEIVISDDMPPVAVYDLRQSL